MKSIINDIRDLVRIFVPIFMFFLAVGTVPGYNARDEVIRDQLLADVKLSKAGESRVLVYQCAMNNLGYVYSVDDNTVQTRGDIAALIDAHTSALTFSAERYQEFLPVISGLLGGATGGITLRSALKAPPGGWTMKQVQKTVLGIIATISGYSAGYYLGSHFDTDCDSRLFTAMIQDPELWRWLEPAKLIISLKLLENLEGVRLAQSGRTLFEWEKDPAFECSTVLQQKRLALESLLSRKVTDFSSADYTLIDDIAGLHMKISTSPAYRTLLELNVYRHSDLADRVTELENTEALNQVIKNRQQQWDSACSSLKHINL